MIRYRNNFVQKPGALTVFFLCLIFSLTGKSLGQAVEVGAGSYSTALPPGAIGPQTASGATAIPKISNSFDQQIQTNDFWSSLIYPFYGDPHSNNLFAHPLNFRAVNTGLQIGYTPNYIFAANDYLYPYSHQLTVGVSGLAASRTVVDSYGDWTVTALWESGARSMEATLGHGLPYTFFRITGGDAVINSSQNPSIWYQQNEVLGITIDGKHFGIFGPTGSSWLGTSTFQSNLNGQDYLSIALLPDTNPLTLELFRSHAYAYVTNSTVDWIYNETTAELTTTYSYETTLMDDGNAANINETLTALYRHQWLTTSNPLTDYNYQSPRGLQKLFEGNSFTTDLTFSGILPALPDQGNYNRAELLALVQSVASETLPIGPSYENGKAMARFANLVHIADQLGAITERDHFLSELKNRLEDWFTVGGEQEYSYNDNWDVLTGYPSGYGADNQINDHHFHASYAIVSAATIAQYDSTWTAQENWGGMVNLLIKDSNNWDREDGQFPYLRTHDSYAGHSWAAGHGDFGDGNNQESSSESMNFASAVILWGEATNQHDIRDLGIFLYTTETTAIEQYWFDVDNEVFPADYAHVALGMVWGAKGVHSTWFGAEPEQIHGINILPVTSGSVYLGRHPDYVLENYDEIVAENNGQPNMWQDVLWEYLALADPDLALSYYYADNSYLPFDGESRAHTLHWLYNLKKMGQVDTTIFADIPTYSVFKDDADDITYIAYNAGSEDRLVTFSDGFSMSVAPREMNSFSTSNANPDAPVVLIQSNRTSGKLPLTVEFTGSNSFDPYGSSISYFWDFNDGETSDAADVEHRFTEIGIFNVSLTVANEQNLSTTDSIMITVLENGTPYLGIPFAIPGVVQAEFYDLGGEGVAYHDNDAVNLGVPFRSSEGVDIEASNDVGGGYNIGWIENGEWVEFTIDVSEAGIYNVIPMIASVPGGGSLHIEFNGIDLTGVRSIPVTGGWQFWQELQIPDVFLSAGEQIMHVSFDTGGFNLNWIEIEASTAITGRGSPEIPGYFELEQNYPNPFNPSTTLKFGLPEAANVSLVIYDIRGNAVQMLCSGYQAAGWYEPVWNGLDKSGRAVPAGLYLARLHAGEYTKTIKMLMLK
ncbi:MAG: glycosyl hydrolase [Candidatus Marinimicrobia bacterium]|nr:glycosyl hydrolase [Candidatus Neomarinimicrobiota bacterium]